MEYSRLPQFIWDSLLRVNHALGYDYIEMINREANG